jgi:hypothetical protein
MIKFGRDIFRKISRRGMLDHYAKYLKCHAVIFKDS